MLTHVEVDFVTHKLANGAPGGDAAPGPTVFLRAVRIAEAEASEFEGAL